MKPRAHIITIGLLSFGLLFLGSIDDIQATTKLPIYRYQILQTLPHPRTTFTQGLAADGNSLLESSGLYGQSFVQRYDRLNGTLQAQASFPAHLFAEGIALINEQLYCLTWKAGIVYILNKNTLIHLKSQRYNGQGWGLARLGNDLLMSDGSHHLSVRAPNTFAIKRQLHVTHAGRKVDRLNDLTVGLGLIWANRWQETDILAIDPQSGVVVGKLPLHTLSQQHRSRDPDQVLNGLAWDTHEKALWVTGKRWNKRYLLKIIEPESADTP